MSHDARAAFSRATELHRQGKLDDAIEVYRRLLKAQPVFEVQRLLVFALLQGRRFKEALQAARRARDAFPGQADSHVLLGAALQASRAWDKALAAYEAAALLDPGLGEAHYLAGNVLTALGRDAEAVVCFDRVLALDPRAAEALANRASALSRLGRLDEALRDCEALTAMQPWEPRHWMSQARALLELGRGADAGAAAEEALRLSPQLAEAHVVRAQGLLGAGDVDAAYAALAIAVALAPDKVAWRLQLVRLARRQGAPDLALAMCDEGLEREPGNAALLQERAEARRALGDPAGALADAEAALALEPGSADTQLDEPQAVEPHDVEPQVAEPQAVEPQAAGPQEVEPQEVAPQAVEPQEVGPQEVAPQEVEAQEAEPQEVEPQEVAPQAVEPQEVAPQVAEPLLASTKAADTPPARVHLKSDSGDAEGAQQAVAGDPASARARHLEALEHLAHARWEQGWAGYQSQARAPAPSFPRWQGQEGVKELVVIGEPGLGDLLLFGRLVRLLADRGLHVRLVTKPRHVPLLARIDARVSVCSSLAGIDAGQPGLFWAPLSALPGLIAPDPANWPRAPYLTADSERVRRWRTWQLAEPPPEPEPPPVAETEGQPAAGPDGAVAPEPEPEPQPEPLLRVGICWRTDLPAGEDPDASLPLAAFAPLAVLDRVELVSLQAGLAEDELELVDFGAQVVRLSHHRDADGTFMDTAGILQHLDIVVTCDTALAQLAGARGRSAFVALKTVCDWRWGRSGAASPLFPSVRLFRRAETDEWSDVLARITGVVGDMLRARRAGQHNYRSDRGAR